MRTSGCAHLKQWIQFSCPVIQLKFQWISLYVLLMTASTVFSPRLAECHLTVHYCVSRLCIVLCSLCLWSSRPWMIGLSSLLITGKHGRSFKSFARLSSSLSSLHIVFWIFIIKQFMHSFPGATLTPGV